MLVAGRDQNILSTRIYMDKMDRMVRVINPF